jgi:hypothetical protein
MPEDLGRERLEELLGAMLETLHGDWLLVGGALVALWLEPRRVTEDIDLVGLAGSADERFELMRFADAAGLAIEAVNSAADFFVRRIPGWENEIVLFRSGRSVRIYRPTPTLVLLLKIARLSDQDLADCRAAIAKARVDSLALDTERVIAALEGFSTPEDGALRDRREALRRALVA